MENKKLKKMEPEDVAIEHPEKILGGAVVEGKDIKTGKTIKLEDGPRDYKIEIEKVPEKERVQQVEMYNPATGHKELVTIDRRGMFDEKLGMILSDKNTTADEKLSATSLWLFEKGRESGSFMIDLIRSKGLFMKGAHEFKSQIRFDFTVFMETFCEYLEDNAQTRLNYLIPGKDVKELEREAYEYLKTDKGKDKDIQDFILENTPPDKYSVFYAMEVHQSIRDASEAQLIRKRIMEIAEQREKERGKGVYLNSSGKPTDKI